VGHDRSQRSPLRYGTHPTAQHPLSRPPPGTPDLLLKLKNSHLLTDCSFHPCIRSVSPLTPCTQTLTSRVKPRPLEQRQLVVLHPPRRQIHLNVIPLRPLHERPNRAFPHPHPIHHQKPHRAHPKYRFSLFPPKPTFADKTPTANIHLTLTPRPTPTPPTDFTLELYLGDDPTTTSVQCTLESSPTRPTSDPTTTTPSAWSYDPKRRVLRWEIGASPAGGTTLSGSWACASGNAPRHTRALGVAFALPRSAWSGVGVGQLKVGGASGEGGYKTYKGARARGVGRVEWRI
jgi:AP-3 complex subunit mu